MAWSVPEDERERTERVLTRALELAREASAEGPLLPRQLLWKACQYVDPPDETGNSRGYANAHLLTMRVADSALDSWAGSKAAVVELLEDTLFALQVGS